MTRSAWDYAVWDEPPPAWHDPSKLRRNPSSKYFPIYARIDRLEVGKWLEVKGFTDRKPAARLQSSLLANQDRLKEYGLGLIVKVIPRGPGIFSVLIGKRWLKV